jgi:tetratricopeptide (TPR) repeat protein
MDLTNEQALQQAVEAHKAGKLKDAEALYRAILQAQPKHPDANHNLGVLAVSLNKSEHALPLFKTALEANPNQGQFWLSYVNTLIKSNQLETAKSVLQQGKKLGLVGAEVDALEAQLTLKAEVENSESILQKQPSSFTQQRKKVSAKKEKKKSAQSNQINTNQVRSPSQVEVNALLEHYQKRRYDLAENLAKKLTQQYPNHQFSWKVLGVVLQLTGRLQESLIANQRAVTILPNDGEAHTNLGNTLKELGRLEEAESSYSKAIAIKPDLAQAHFNLGNTLKELGRLEEAESSYSEAIAIKPDLAEAHINLGNTLKELGRLEEAEASCRKAIAIKPDLAEAHINLGNILQELGRLEEAEASYSKAIAIKPDLAEAHTNLGNTLKELGKLENAEASHRKAIAINPDLAEAHSNMGATLQTLGRLEDAEASCRKAIAIKPDYAQAHSNLGLTLKELGKLEEAEASCKKAIAIKPGLADAHINLGNTLKELGRFKETEASYKKAISLKPDYEAGQYNLGIWYCEQGKYKQAAELFLKSKNFKSSQSYLLKCLYFLNYQQLFYEQLESLTSHGIIDAIIGSFGCRAEIKFGIEKANLFCSSPLNYVFKTDLSKKYDFEGKFVKPSLSILNDKKAQNRSQTLLTNGLQTSGNLFALENILIDEIKKIIELEIENYRLYFKDSKEGLIKNWPDAYSLYGWIIRMKNGGALHPHMHEKGWISGSVYINVPPKLNINDGNLVVCIEDDALLSEPQDNKKNIIDVTTGSLCLFPASLLHYTIPFVSDEERIVLAFDVIPIK